MRGYWPLVALAAIIGIPTEGLVLYNQIQQARISTTQADILNTRMPSLCIMSDTCDEDGYEASHTGKPIKSLRKQPADRWTPEVSAQREYLRQKKIAQGYLSPVEDSELSRLTLIVMEHIAAERR